MAKVKVMCNEKNGVLMLYNAAKRVIFGSRVNAADAIKEFPVPCGDSIAILDHQWTAKLEILNLPTDYNDCQIKIIPALAKALLFNPDLTTDYRFDLQQTVRQDKCFLVNHRLFTVYELYDIVIYPIDAASKITGKGKKFQVYKPVDKTVQKEPQIENPCCFSVDDINLIAFTAVAPTLDSSLFAVNDNFSLTDDKFVAELDSPPITSNVTVDTASQMLRLRLPAEEFVVRREILPIGNR